MSLLEDLLGGLFDSGGAPRPARRRRRSTAAALPDLSGLLETLVGGLGDLFDEGGPANANQQYSSPAGPFPSESSIPSIRLGGRRNPFPPARLSLEPQPPALRRREEKALAEMQRLLRFRPQMPDRSGPQLPPSPRLEAASGERSGESVDPIELAVERSVIQPAQEAGVLPERQSTGQSIYEGLATLAPMLVPGAGVVGAAGRAGKGAELLAGLLRGSTTASRGARAAQTAARAATFPIRNRAARRGIFASPLALEAPSAAIHGDPAQLEKALEGTGVAASIAGTAGEAVGSVLPGVAGNAVKDLLQLPAQALPSVYLPAAGAVEAAQGRPERIEQLWQDYTETGLIPQLASGDLGGALAAAAEHPLFTGLEASGLYALTGRGLGAAARRGAFGERGRAAGDTAREPLHIYGDVAQPREFSPNLVTSLLQQRSDARIAESGRRTIETRGARDPLLTDPNQASPRQADQYLRGALLEGARRDPTGAVDRLVSQLERTRRSNQEQVRAYRSKGQVKAYKTLPALIAQGEIRTPETFFDDLARARVKLLAARAETGEGALLRSERANNTAQLKDIEAAMRLSPDSPRVAELFTAAEHYGQGLKGLERDIVDLGLYDPEAVRVAKLFPYALAHEGASFGRGGDVTTRQTELQTNLANLTSQRDQVRTLEKRLERGGDPQQLQAARESRAALTDEIKQMRNETTALLNDNPERLLDRQGAPLDLDALEARAKEALGGREPAFLTHRPGFRGRGNFYQSAYAGRGRGQGQRRTGEAFQRGGYDASLAALDEQHLHLQTIADRARHADQIVADFAMRQPNGDWWKSWGSASNVARDPEAYGVQTNGVPMKPIRIAPMRALSRELEAVRGREDLSDAPTLGLEDFVNPEVVPMELRNRVRHALEQAMQPGSGKGDIGLIPETVAQRLLEHNAAPRRSEKVLQSYTSAFKNTVLPLSHKWALGNIFEVSMRSMFNGLGLGQPGTSLGYRKLGKRYLDAYEREHGADARRKLEAQLIGEGQYGSVKQTELNRKEMHDFSRAMDAIVRTPGPREVYRLWDTYKRAIFAGNGWLERQPRYAALGKGVKKQVDSRIKKFHSALRVSDDALKELAKGAVKTRSQERYDHYIADVFGNWTRLSPDARYVLTTYAPFYMWARASSRFVFLTLPIKHPVKTAMLAAANEMTEEERQRLGLDLFTQDRLPGFLQGGLPLGGEIHPASNYSSFGVFSNYPNALSSFILPQFGGAIDTLRGLSWTGERIQKSGGGEPDQAELAALAFYTQLEATMPVLALARRIREGGGSSEDTSNIFSPKVTESTQEGRSLRGGFARAFGFRGYGGDTLDYLRALPTAQTVTVPSADSAASEATGGIDADFIDGLLEPSDGSGVTADEIDKLLNP